MFSGGSPVLDDDDQERSQPLVKTMRISDEKFHTARPPTREKAAEWLSSPTSRNSERNMAGEDGCQQSAAFWAEFKLLRLCIRAHALDAKQASCLYSIFVGLSMCGGVLFSCYFDDLDGPEAIIVLSGDVIYPFVWYCARTYLTDSSAHFQERASIVLGNGRIIPQLQQNGANVEQNRRRVNNFLLVSALVTLVVGCVEKAFEFTIIGEPRGLDLALKIFGSVTFAYRLHGLFVVFLILMIVLAGSIIEVTSLGQRIRNGIAHTRTNEAALEIVREYARYSCYLKESSRLLQTTVGSFIVFTMLSFFLILFGLYMEYLSWRVPILTFDFVVNWILGMLIIFFGAKVSTDFRQPYRYIRERMAQTGSLRGQLGSSLQITNFGDEDDGGQQGRFMHAWDSKCENVILLMRHFKDHACSFTVFGVPLEMEEIMKWGYILSAITVIVAVRIMPSAKNVTD
mmetsp:Transcript_18930/g.30776  ORF Transcript_18930/g.30776 Transcript_18930/m.30776 type:complete len:456 (+) Transcript_18930:54-1421(+)